MASLPPEHPDFQPQAEPLEDPTAEPRLLTRRSLHDGADPPHLSREQESSSSSQDGAFSGGRLSRGRRQSFHPLRSLESLRDRIGQKNLQVVREEREARQASAAEPPVRRSPAQHLSRTLRRLLTAVAGLVLLCILAVFAFAFFLRHDMRAALPQLDGELHLAGLTAPVNVTRDQQGVPSIQAGTLNDLLFAQGFVTAQDRLWQMDSLRRHAAGELAEILGASMVEHDRQQRILQLRAAADRAVLTLPSDQLAQLQAYARGVNAFVESHGDRLPVEFHLLHYQPAAWTPSDSLLVSLAMFQDLATSYPTKLHREALAQHLPPELLADLYPTRSWRDQPPTQPPPDLTAPKPEILQIPLDATQVKLEDLSGKESGAPAPASGTQVFGGSSQACPECRPGSNNWAVSGQHSASGKPLVSNDMHLGLSVPDIWYEAGLHIAPSAPEPAMDVTGFSLPGVPFVIVGRNAHVAWGFTNLGADVQDLHIEHLRGTGENTQFQQADGSWAPVAHHRELIRVRGGHDRVLDVLTTTARIGGSAIDTPIISPLSPTEKRAISLLWTPYDPHTLSSPFYAVNIAASGSALVASLASFGGPSLNLVYADEAGHIGYHALGHIPIRGPAEHHPRVLPQELAPRNGAAPPDEAPGEETTGDSTQPEAQLSHGRSPFLSAGYVRRSRRRRAEQPARVPVTPTPDETVPPTPLLRDYTIGSPLPIIPVDALDPSMQWSGYIPYEELPAIVDPADGVLATANARITPDDYPYFLADDWAPPYRVERIRKLLAGRTRLSPADMLAVETDTTSAFDRLVAERLTYALDNASNLGPGQPLAKDAKRLRQAADQLRSWTGTMTVDSPAAAIVSVARPQIWQMLMTSQIARHDHLKPDDPRAVKLAALYDWGQQTTVLETLLTFQPARWLPPGFASWNDFLAAAVSRSLAQSGAPGDLSRWKYGGIHQVNIVHPVFSISPLLGRMLGAQTGTGSQPIGGDGTTIDATSRAFGPSERFTADLADPAATTGNITTGQAGNPAGPHYLDQFSAWLHGTTLAMPLHGAPAQHTLRLLP